MQDIRIEFRDGTHTEFTERRQGGSYTNSVSYEGEFVLVTDVWDATYAFPAALIHRVTAKPRR